MRCVLLEEDNTCQAGIGVKAWKINNEKLVNEICKTDKFVDCPRLKTYVAITTASNALKVKIVTS